MSTDGDKEREVTNARVDKAVAEDVARGMAAKADREEARADVLSGQVDAARAERDAAAMDNAAAREQTRSASFGFWLLLGVAAVVLLIGAIWVATRPGPASSVVNINRQPTVAPTQPATPLQVQTPASSPAPLAPVQRRDTPVAVERQAPVPVQTPARQPDRAIVVQPSRGDSAASGSPAPENGTASEKTTTAPSDTGTATGQPR